DVERDEVPTLEGEERVGRIEQRAVQALDLDLAGERGGEDRAAADRDVTVERVGAEAFAADRVLERGERAELVETAADPAAGQIGDDLPTGAERLAHVAERGVRHGSSPPRAGASS